MTRHRYANTPVPHVDAETVAGWQPSKINATLDKLAKLSSALTDEFIEVGRGYERPSETWQLSDPLAERYKSISRATSTLRNEIAHRYGPGAPSRLPRGFGPTRRL